MNYWSAEVHLLVSWTVSSGRGRECFNFSLLGQLACLEWRALILSFVGRQPGAVGRRLPSNKPTFKSFQLWFVMCFWHSLQCFSPRVRAISFRDTVSSTTESWHHAWRRARASHCRDGWRLPQVRASNFSVSLSQFPSPWQRSLIARHWLLDTAISCSSYAPPSSMQIPK